MYEKEFKFQGFNGGGIEIWMMMNGCYVFFFLRL
jgi:hypothetical protein